MTARTEDVNGYIEIENNPISKVGVFPYSGAQIGAEPPDKVFMVYRPESELNNVDCINSFKLVPVIDEHTMLGDGQTPAEKKGVHGTTGEKIYFKDGYLYANLKIFSDSLQATIDNIKKDISLGYRCIYELSSGMFNGVQYDAVQKNIRGNHLAIVEEGRMGREVAVLDHATKFTFDSKELIKMVQKAELKALKDKVAVVVAALDEAEKAEKMEATDMEKMRADVNELMGMIKDLKAHESSEAEDKDEDKKDGDMEKDSGDADEEKKDDEKKESMDSATVAKMIKAAQDETLKTIARKNKLYDRVSPIIGAFDHSEMTLSDVEKYSAKKLELSVAEGQEGSAIEGFLKAHKPAKEFTVQDSARVNTLNIQNNPLDKHFFQGDK
jgi:hypothetical protein